MLSLPNALTLLRVVLIGPVLILAHREQTVAAVATYLVLLSTDMLDGFAARKLNQETALGEYFDFVADFACYYVFIGYFVAIGRLEWFNTLLTIIATLALGWIGITLAKKAKQLYMPHRTSSKILAVMLTVGIGWLLIGWPHENAIFLGILALIYFYTLPDYIRYTLTYKSA